MTPTWQKPDAAKAPAGYWASAPYLDRLVDWLDKNTYVVELV